MKKIVVSLMVLALLGCGEAKKEPVKDTIDRVVESKETSIKLQVMNMLKEAETKWMMGIDKTCINPKELVSGREAEGQICINEEYSVYAKDIVYQDYICNGTKDKLNCVGELND